jgi:hypothetical protein
VLHLSLELTLKRKLTTAKLFIGNPEAESEANFKSRVKLDDVFEDYMKILPDLETEKFIVTGRKGSGKSAIGTTIYNNSKKDANRFCCFVRKNDFDLEEIVQISNKTDYPIQKELLFKWLILTRVLRLITENEAINSQPEIKILKEFLKKNTGFVDINKYEIKEIISANGFQIHIEKFLRFLRLTGKKETTLTGQKAPFYKLIPHLEDAIIDILTRDEEKNNGNSYRIIIDDLDIDFKAENTTIVQSTLELIRIVKDYNNNLFSDNEIDAKVIILLRDDISSVLIRESADMAKIFRSYAIRLRWYQHKLYLQDENLTKLKQFINKRIGNTLRENNINFESQDPWNFLLNDNEINTTSFKYIVDHTFQTPRDLILLFEDLDRYEFNIPLKMREMNSLISSYAIKSKEEIENALAIHFSSSEIEKIFNLLRDLSKTNDFDLIQFTDFVGIHGIEKEGKLVLDLLYEYSLVGNRADNGTLYFNYWENEYEAHKIDYETKFVLHRILSIYYKNSSN